MLRTLYEDLKLPELIQIDPPLDLPPLNGKLKAQIERSHEKLFEFISSRGWPSKVLGSLAVGYLCSAVIDLHAWGQARNFSREDLFEAGIFERTVSKDGYVNYRQKDHNTVKIFFPRIDGEIRAGRTRQNDQQKAKKQKYTGQRLDRAKDVDRSLEEKVFNSQAIFRATENDILIVLEGEFKAAVVEALTGYPASGILGISETDEDFFQALSRCKAKKILLLLDSDSKGKAIQRGTNTTDSQRASYKIGHRIEALGKEVLVGIVPQHSGKKAGGDDYLLDLQTSNYREVFDREILDVALPPDEYASTILGINPEMLQINIKIELLRQALTHYYRSERRGGPKAPEEVIEDAEKLLWTLRDKERIYLRENFYVTSHSSPFKGVGFPIKPGPVPNADGKFILSETGKAILVKSFEQSIQVLIPYPEDLHEEVKIASAQGITMRFSMSKLIKEIQNQSLSDENAALIRSGLEVIPELAENIGDLAIIHTHAMRDYIALAYAGALQDYCPSDEFDYVYRAGLYERQQYGYDVKDKIPFIILKKDTNTVAAVVCPPWWDNEETGREIDAQKRATLRATRKRRNFQGFVRNSNLRKKQDEFKGVVRTVVEFSRDLLHHGASYSKHPVLSIVLPVLGISDSIAERQQIGFIQSGAQERGLIPALTRKRQLSAAMMSGLLLSDDQYNPHVRIEGDSIILPEISENKVSGVRFAPLDYQDHLSSRLSPGQRPVHRLDSRALTRSIGTKVHGNMYLVESVPENPETLYVTQDELSGLQTASWLDTQQQYKNGVVALNGHMRAPQEAVETIASFKPQEIKVIAYFRATAVAKLFKKHSIIPNVVELASLQDKLSYQGVDSHKINFAFLETSPAALFRERTEVDNYPSQSQRFLGQFFTQFLLPSFLPLKEIEQRIGLTSVLKENVSKLITDADRFFRYIEEAAPGKRVNEQILQNFRKSWNRVKNSHPGVLSHDNVDAYACDELSLDNNYSLEELTNLARLGPPLTLCRGVIFTRSLSNEGPSIKTSEEFLSLLHRLYGERIDQKPDGHSILHPSLKPSWTEAIIKNDLAFAYVRQLQDENILSITKHTISKKDDGSYRVRLKVVIPDTPGKFEFMGDGSSPLEGLQTASALLLREITERNTQLTPRDDSLLIHQRGGIISEMNRALRIFAIKEFIESANYIQALELLINMNEWNLSLEEENSDIPTRKSVTITVDCNGEQIKASSWYDSASNTPADFRTKQSAKHRAAHSLIDQLIEIMNSTEDASSQWVSIR